ncbi:MAG: hypothetical protein ABIT01_20310 [Thermoanaerobaculia bacterium]
MPRSSSMRISNTLFVSAVFTLALVIRFLPLSAATEGGLRLLSPDCYGHLRRSASVARNFPRVPVFDSYLNPPDGGVWIWPPLFDLAIGGIARLLFGRAATLTQVAAVAATLPPILGALHVLPLFALARRALSVRRARLAITAYAVMPAAAVWSCFGHADHHVAEGFGLLLFLSASAVVCRAGLGRRTAALASAGGALAVALLIWQGAVFIAGIGLFFAAMAWGAAAPLVGAVATVLLALGTAATLRGQIVPFAFVSFGWFQPLLLAGATLALCLLAALKTRGARRLAWLAASAALALLVAPNVGNITAAILRGSAYLVTGNPQGSGDDFADGGYLSYPQDFLRIVAEAQPLLRAPWGASLGRALQQLSPGLLVLPFALALWAWTVVRRRPLDGRPAVRLLLVLFGGALLAMTIFQVRNVYYLAIFSALALAELVGRVRLGGRLLGPVAAPLLTLALVAVPGRSVLAHMKSYADAPGWDLLDLLERLRQLDPPAVDPAVFPQPRPGAIASVMAPWAAGHFVTALAQRPAAADPLVYGWRRQCRLYSTPDDAEALQILHAARCRYLVTMDLSPVLPSYAAAAGRAGTPLSRMFALRMHRSAELHPAPFLTRVLDSSTAARGPDGVLTPRFRVFRVEGVADESPARTLPDVANVAGVSNVADLANAAPAAGVP